MKNIITYLLIIGLFGICLLAIGTCFSLAECDVISCIANLDENGELVEVK